MKILKILLKATFYAWIFVIVALLALMLFVPQDMDAYRPMLFSKERADDIAYALLIYKAKTGTVPDFDKPGWTFLIKDFLNDYSKAAVTAQGEIKDSKGNSYELTRHARKVDIFSYAMIDPRRVDLDTGAVTLGSETAFQAIRALFFQGYYCAGGLKYFKLPESPPLHPKILTFAQEKCQCAVPADRLNQKNDGDQISVANIDRTKVFEIKITKAVDKTANHGPGFLNHLEDGLTPEGTTIADRQYDMVVAGADADSFDATRAVLDGFLIDRVTIVLAKEYTYALYVSKLNAKPWEDGELNSIINSFAIVGTP